MSFSEQLVHDLSNFLAHLRVIDERSGKVHPLDFRRAAVQRSDALRCLTDLCADAVAALLRNGARCALHFSKCCHGVVGRARVQLTDTDDDRLGR